MVDYGYERKMLYYELYWKFNMIYWCTLEYLGTQTGLQEDDLQE